jgi:hypothetical protein
MASIRVSDVTGLYNEVHLSLSVLIRNQARDRTANSLALKRFHH